MNNTKSIRQHLQSSFNTIERATATSAFAMRIVNSTDLLSTISPTGIASFIKRTRDSDLLKAGPHIPLLFHAANSPHRIAITDENRRLTWRELDEEVNQVCNALAQAGVRSGDRIALMLRNSCNYITIQQALVRLGAASVQISYRLKSLEIAYMLQDSTPSAFFFNADYASIVSNSLKHCKISVDTLVSVNTAESTSLGVDYNDFIVSQDKMFDRDSTNIEEGSSIVYTSGTTGKPKGAVRNLKETGTASLGDFILRIGMKSNENHLIVCPLYHTGGYGFFWMTFALGGRNLLLEHFDPIEFLKIVERERITCSFLVPIMVAKLAALDKETRDKYDLSSLRWVACGAAPLPTETARQFQNAYGDILWNLYGATETGIITLAAPDDHTNKPCSIGTVLRGNHCRILDKQKNDVPLGEIGELYVRNRMLIRGYHNAPQATSDALHEGYFSVGDLATMDEDGHIYLLGRKSDMIISGGTNIYPREIEEHLLTHPNIVECAVVGVSSTQWGEAIKAFIVSTKDLSEDDVITFCKEGLAGFKQPRFIEFRDSLPRTTTGKILKNKLREESNTPSVAYLRDKIKKNQLQKDKPVTKDSSDNDLDNQILKNKPDIKVSSDNDSDNQILKNKPDIKVSSDNDSDNQTLKNKPDIKVSSTGYFTTKHDREKTNRIRVTLPSEKND